MRFNYKNIIAISCLIVAISIGYYFLVFLPKSQQEQAQIKTRQASILNECLSAALDEKGRLNGETIKWAQEDNKDGKYDLTGAFESINKLYKQDREDCFATYIKR